MTINIGNSASPASAAQLQSIRKSLGLGTGVPIPVLASRALADADSSEQLEPTASVNLSIPASLADGFNVLVTPFGTTTFTPTGGALINGSALAQTRLSSDGGVVFLKKDKSVANNFTLTTNAITPASDGGISAGMTKTFAELVAMTGLPVNARAYATDLGPYRTELVWNGTDWKLLAPCVVAQDLTTSNGGSSNSLQQIKSLTVSKKLLRLGRTFSIEVMFGKNGATASAASARLLAGPAGNTADVMILNSSLMNSAARTLGFRSKYKLTDAATMTSVSDPRLTSGEFPGTGAALPPVDIVIPNVDTTDMVLSAWIQIAAATDVPQVHAISVTVQP